MSTIPYDFRGWVIKYKTPSIRGLTYQKDSLKNCDGKIVPLCWNHGNFDPECVLGNALLVNKEEGVYMFGTLTNTDTKDVVLGLLRDRGSVSLSPYINQVKTVNRFITHGVIREVSLVLERIDPDECYYPVLIED